MIKLERHVAAVGIHRKVLYAEDILDRLAYCRDRESYGVELIALNDGADVVMGVRKDRSSDSWFKRFTAQSFYKLMRRMGADITYNHADYRLLSRRAAYALKRYQERNLFLRGIVKQMGYRQECVYYDRTERLAGESKYPLAKMLNFAVDGITSFSVKPVRFIFTLGAIFILIALGILAYVLHAYFTGSAVSGWSSMMLSLWFIGGCLLIALGIVGEYIAKIYLEVKNRPRYHIEDILNA